MLFAYHAGSKPVTWRKDANKCTNYSAVGDCIANIARDHAEQVRAKGIRGSIRCKHHYEITRKVKRITSIIGRFPRLPWNSNQSPLHNRSNICCKIWRNFDEHVMCWQVDAFKVYPISRRSQTSAVSRHTDNQILYVSVHENSLDRAEGGLDHSQRRYPSNKQANIMEISMLIEL